MRQIVDRVDWCDNVERSPESLLKALLFKEKA